MLEVTCGDCGAKFKAPPKFAGRKMRCKHCSGTIVIGEEEVVLSDLLPDDDELQEPVSSLDQGTDFMQENGGQEAPSVDLNFEGESEPSTKADVFPSKDSTVVKDGVAGKQPQRGKSSGGGWLMPSLVALALLVVGIGVLVAIDPGLLKMFEGKGAILTDGSAVNEIENFGIPENSTEIGVSKGASTTGGDSAEAGRVGEDTKELKKRVVLKSPPKDLDPIKASLTNARKEYEDKTNSSKDKLVQAFDQAIRSYSDAGDLSGVKSLMAEKTAFLRSGELPIVAAMFDSRSEYRQAIGTPTQAFASKLKSAVELYTKKLQIDKATKVQSELEKVIHSLPKKGKVTKVLLKEFEVVDEVTEIAWSPDGESLVVCRQGPERKTTRTGVLLYDVENGKLERQLKRSGTGNAYNPVWNPVGNEVAFCVRHGDKEYVQIFEGDSGEELIDINIEKETLFDVDWSPDGKKIVTFGGIEFSGVVTLWDAASGRELHSVTLPGYKFSGGKVVSPASMLFCGAWSPDGKRIAGGGMGDVMVWNAVNLRQVTRLPGVSFSVKDVAWSPNSSILAVVDSIHKPVTEVEGVRPQGTITLWNAISGEEYFKVRGKSGPYKVAWSPDGNMLAWNEQSSFEIDALGKGGTQEGVSLRLLDLGSAIDKGVQVVATGDQKYANRSIELPSAKYNVFAFSWNPDGTKLASCSAGGNVQVWGFLK